MKLYRVNSSEVFNLFSMYDRLKCDELKMIQSPPHSFSNEEWQEIQSRIEEIETLKSKAYAPGALVEWPVLKRIREIQAERQYIRYNRCKSSGLSDDKAFYSFMV